MKRYMATLAVIAVLAVPAFAQSDIWSNVGFGLSSYPEENGNITEGYLSYRFTPLFTPVVNVRTVTSADTGEIEGTDKSLNLTRESTTEVFIYPASLSLQVSEGNRLYLTGGLYISAQGTREVGYFDLSTSTEGAIGLNSYDNSIRATFYGPVISAGMGFAFPYTQVTVMMRCLKNMIFLPESGGNT